MHRSAALRWGAAALVAVVTSLVVASDLAALHRRASSLGPERSVVVAARDLSLGTTTTDEDFSRRDVHESQLPPGAIDDIDDVRDRVVVVPMLEGSFITARHLAPAERDGLDGVVPIGSRAVRVRPVSTPPLRPGDIVDVLAIVDRGGSSDARVAAPAALVLRFDDASSASSGPDATSTTAVTLLVSADDAATVAEATAMGALTLALASPEEAMSG